MFLGTQTLHPEHPNLGSLLVSARRGNKPYVSYSLNSLKGGYIRDYIGDEYRGLL